MLEVRPGDSDSKAVLSALSLAPARARAVAAYQYRVRAVNLSLWSNAVTQVAPFSLPVG